MSRIRLRPAVAKAASIVAVVLVSGCAREGAPSFIVAGSYFPAWMACAFAGIFVALLFRVILGRLEIDGSIAYPLTFYRAAAVVAGVGVWLFGFAA